VVKLVVFDDYEGGDQRIEGKLVERKMNDGSRPLLGCGVGRLEDENSFGDEEDGRGVEKGVRGEEGERMEKDAGPDESCEEYDAALSYDSRTNDQIPV